MYSLQNSPRNILLDVTNQQEDRAKKNLYEIEEFEERLYFQTFYKNHSSVKVKDSLEKWALIKNDGEYQKFSNIQQVNQKVAEKTKTRNNPHIQSFHKIKKQMLKSLQSSIKRLSKKQTQYQKHPIVCVNQMFDFKQNPKQPVNRREKRYSQTPIIQADFPAKADLVINSKREAQVYSSSRETYKKQRSLSGALNLIKRQTQSTQKQNKKAIFCRISQKQALKIRNEWMSLQKFPNFKQKDKLNLALY